MTVRHHFVAIATAAVALLGATSAFAGATAGGQISAGEGDVLIGTPTAGGALSRQQVLDELALAIRDGSLIAGGEYLQAHRTRPAAAAEAALSREQVKQATLAALRRGELTGAGEATMAGQPAPARPAAITAALAR